MKQSDKLIITFSLIPIVGFAITLLCQPYVLEALGALGAVFLTLLLSPLAVFVLAPLANALIFTDIVQSITKKK